MIHLSFDDASCATEAVEKTIRLCWNYSNNSTTIYMTVFCFVMVYIKDEPDSEIDDDNSVLFSGIKDYVDNIHHIERKKSVLFRTNNLYIIKNSSENLN